MSYPSSAKSETHCPFYSSIELNECYYNCYYSIFNSILEIDNKYYIFWDEFSFSSVGSVIWNKLRGPEIKSKPRHSSFLTYELSIDTHILSFILIQNCCSFISITYKCFFFKQILTFEYKIQSYRRPWVSSAVPGGDRTQHLASANRVWTTAMRPISRINPPKLNNRSYQIEFTWKILQE